METVTRATCPRDRGFGEIEIGGSESEIDPTETAFGGSRIATDMLVSRLLEKWADLSLLIVALLAQSLVMFKATEDSLIDATTTAWPDGIELWPSFVVLSFNLLIMIFAFGIWSQRLANRVPVMVVSYFCRYSVVKDSARAYTFFLVFSAIVTSLTYIVCAVILKSQPLSALPLYSVSCLLAAESHQFEHITICQSNVIPRYRSANDRIGLSIAVLLALSWTCSSFFQFGSCTAVAKLKSLSTSRKIRSTPVSRNSTSILQRQ